MTFPIAESPDRRSLPPGNATGEAGAQAPRPREKERGAVDLRTSALGRTYCLACGAPLGPELLHVGPPTLLGRIYAAAT